LLLDTHIILWAAFAPRRLPPQAQILLADEKNSLTFSVVSLWEIAIKRGLGRADFTVDPRRLRRGLLDNGYDELPVAGPHILALDSLPHVHRDPFNRLLVAQATAEGITLVTADPLVGRYPGPIELT
jgi:PIN domain nuclease of toxin-antitoxin system